MAADQHRAHVRTTREAQGYVAGDGIQLAFGYWPGRGSPLVALHGLTASYVTFVGIAERLAGRRALFPLDLRGRGRSDKPPSPYGMTQHASDVAAAMRSMDLGASIIIGHSMGGFVATALAEQAPELVAGLVLLDGGYAPIITVSGSQPSLDAALTLRINQLRQTYPSREAYRQFWRAQPHFPPEAWGPGSKPSSITRSTVSRPCCAPEPPKKASAQMLWRASTASASSPAAESSAFPCWCYARQPASSQEVHRCFPMQWWRRCAPASRKWKNT